MPKPTSIPGRQGDSLAGELLLKYLCIFFVPESDDPVKVWTDDKTYPDLVKMFVERIKYPPDRIDSGQRVEIAVLEKDSFTPTVESYLTTLMAFYKLNWQIKHIQNRDDNSVLLKADKAKMIDHQPDKLLYDKDGNIIGSARPTDLSVTCWQGKTFAI